MKLLRLKFSNQLEKKEEKILNTSSLGQKVNRHFLYNPISQNYYKEYMGKSAIFKSLIVFDKDEPVLIMPFLCSSDHLNFADGPSEVFCNLDSEDQSDIIIFLANILKKTEKGTFLKFRNNSQLFKEFYTLLTNVEFRHEGFVDLTLKENYIYKNIRKSYRPFINWGKNKLHVNIVDQKNPNLDEFKKFKNLHFAASGRKTRNDLTWHYQMDMIKAGFGYLVNAHIDDNLVSSCFVMCDKDIALYAVAASDRDLMRDNLPINHFPLYYSILEAKRRGCKIFKIGDISFSNDKKLNNIALFKRGFVTKIAIDNIITIQF